MSAPSTQPTASFRTDSSGTVAPSAETAAALATDTTTPGADVWQRSSGSLGRRTMQGAMWVAVSILATKLVNSLGYVVLAWLLLPEHFGKIGLTYTITTLSGAIAGGGLAEVLVQRQHRLGRYINAATWLGGFSAVVATVLILLAAPLAALVYDEPEVIGLLAVMALAVPLQGLAVAPRGVLMAQLRFGAYGVLVAGQGVATMLLTIALAAAGLGAYSFAWPAPLAALVMLLVYWAVVGQAARRRLRPYPQWRRCRLLFDDAVHMTGSRLLINLSSQGDYMILGILQSSMVVGVYYFGFNLAAQVPRLLGYTLSSLLHPALSHLPPGSDRQANAALEALRLVAFCAIPLCLLQAAAAGPVEAILFDGRWIAAVPVVQLLSAGLSVSTASWISEALLRAQGRFRTQTRLLVASFCLMLGCVTAGTLLAPALGYGAAAGTAAGYALFALIYQLLALRTAFVPTAVVSGRAAWGAMSPLVAGGLAWGTAWLADERIQSEILSLAAIITCFTAVYVVISALISPDLFRVLYQRVRGALGREEAAPAPEAAAEAGPRV